MPENTIKNANPENTVKPLGEDAVPDSKMTEPHLVIVNSDPAKGVTKPQVETSSKWSFVSLMPYKHLRTPMTTLWFAFAYFVIILMSVTEGIAWGYVGSLMGTGSTRVIIGVLIGVGWFGLIFVNDLKMILADLWSHEYRKKVDQAIAGESANGKPGWFRTTVEWARNNSKFLISFAMRGAFAILSLTVTAPFLGLLVFNDDISEYLKTHNTQVIATTRTSIENRHAQGIDAIRNDIKRLQFLKHAEASGQKMKEEFHIPGSDRVVVVSTTGIPNGNKKGPSTQMLEQLQKEFETAVQGSETVKNKEITEFEKLVNAGEYSQLRERWNVDLKASTLDNRFAALDVLSKQPAHAMTDHAIKVGLLMILGLLTMVKLFQPKMAHLYLSEYAQGKFEEYLRGNFDEWLPQWLRSVVKPMPPVRFEEFLLKDYPTWNANELQKANDRRRHGDVREIQSEIEAEYNLCVSAYVSKKEELETAEADCANNEIVVEKKRRTVAELSRQLDDLVTTRSQLARSLVSARVVDPDSVAVQQKIMSDIQTLKMQVRNETDQLDEMERKHKQVEAKVTLLQADVEQLKTGFTRLSSELTQVQAAQTSHRADRLRRASEPWTSVIPARPMTENGTPKQKVEADQVQ